MIRRTYKLLIIVGNSQVKAMLKHNQFYLFEWSYLRRFIGRSSPKSMSSFNATELKLPNEGLSGEGLFL